MMNDLPVRASAVKSRTLSLRSSCPEAGSAVRATWARLSSQAKTLLTLCLTCHLLTACNNGIQNSQQADPLPDRLANFAHLDHLGEKADSDESVRIVHIYAEAPDYHWVGDDDEGIACVDDAARAAIVYLRDYELSGNALHRQAGEELLRFILTMQDESGLFYNFVWDNQLTINKTFRTSHANDFDWWSARAVWALGVGARVLKNDNPELSAAARFAVERTYPHLDGLLSKYGQTQILNGRHVPLWLVQETAADATSELLLGLHALHRTHPTLKSAELIDRFAEGIERMQWGSMATFPWAAHGSWLDAWHGWGNSQVQALSELGRLETAIREAEHFYPRLLISGWMHSFNLDDPDSIRAFEQIAYAVRAVSVGLLRLHEATGNDRYAVMAGLAASWFTGNNVAQQRMYDPSTGRGYDGINDASHINRNAGAESTIEAVFTVLEIDNVPVARHWIAAKGDEPVELDRDGKHYLYRVFTVQSDASPSRLALVMNLTDEKLDVLFDSELEKFLTVNN